MYNVANALKSPVCQYTCLSFHNQCKSYTFSWKHIGIKEMSYAEGTDKSSGINREIIMNDKYNSIMNSD